MQSGRGMPSLIRKAAWIFCSTLDNAIAGEALLVCCIRAIKPVLFAVFMALVLCRGVWGSATTLALAGVGRSLPALAADSHTSIFAPLILRLGKKADKENNVPPSQQVCSKLFLLGPLEPFLDLFFPVGVCSCSPPW